MAKQQIFPPGTAFNGDYSLTLEAVACVRGNRVLFDDVCLQLKPGRACALYGVNGSGKTSLLRQIAGLLPVAAGRINFTGSGSLAVNCHYLGHMTGLKDQLDIDETLAFASGLFACPSATPVPDVLAKLGLGTSQNSRGHNLGGLRVGDLSAGQKRRLMLARLMVAPRPVWLLDEPMTAMDAAGCALVVALVKAHLEIGGMVVAASHQPLSFATQDITLVETLPETLSKTLSEILVGIDL